MGGAVLLTMDNAPLATPPANAAHIAVGKTFQHRKFANYLVVLRHAGASL